MNNRPISATVYMIVPFQGIQLQRLLKIMKLNREREREREREGGREKEREV